MPFRYRLETVNKNGLHETAVQELNRDQILLGRGASADILLSSNLVSLEHARLTVIGSKLYIEDLDSLSGVLINEKLVRKQARLRAGDSIKIGDFSLKLLRDGETWELYEKREERAAGEDLETKIARLQRRFSIYGYIPSNLVSSTVLGLAVFVFFLGVPLFSKNKASWNSGPISNAHKMIEEDCVQCHQQAFIPVKDEACLACHKLSDHSDKLLLVYKVHPELNLRCATCHMEHNGVGIIASESLLCADCHSRLNEIFTESTRADIPSFRKHPEFRVLVAPQPLAPKGTPVQRISLADQDKLIDNTQLKLNHKIHLEPELRGTEGPVTLTCGDCHEYTADLAEIKPITFEERCASCHPLEFDDKLPGKQVPHGDPNLVYAFLYAEYAKLVLSNQVEENEEEGAIRRIPGQELARGEALEFTRRSITAKSREAERTLFERTACQLCHTVIEKDDRVLGTDANRSGKFEVIPPKMPVKWMQALVYSHGTHQEIRCQSCHLNVSQSEKTTDVLLPGIKDCRECHAQQKSRGVVVSDCIMCHSYHNQLIINDERKRRIEEILGTVPIFQASPVANRMIHGREK